MDPRPRSRSAGTDKTKSLNALSGIGGVWTPLMGASSASCCGSLNALSGIGGVWTRSREPPAPPRRHMCLNALSGIGGVWTHRWGAATTSHRRWVLMPCRALEAFGRGWWVTTHRVAPRSLNALSGIGGVWTNSRLKRACNPTAGLNALSGIGGVWTSRRGIAWHGPANARS